MTVGGPCSLEPLPPSSRCFDSAAVAGSGNDYEEASVTAHDVISPRHDGDERDTTQLSPTDIIQLRAQLLRELE